MLLTFVLVISIMFITSGCINTNKNLSVQGSDSEGKTYYLPKGKKFVSYSNDTKTSYASIVIRDMRKGETPERYEVLSIYGDKKIYIQEQQ